MYIPSSSYEAIWKRFYKLNFTEINKWADNFLKNNFSNVKVRVLYSHLYNPFLFESVTLMMDSKDIVVILSNEESEYRQNKSGKSSLISRKNGWSNAGKTNFVIDCQAYLKFQKILMKSHFHVQNVENILKKILLGVAAKSIKIQFTN